MARVTLPQLGPLKRDPNFPEWQISAPVSVAYLGGSQVPFVIDNIEHDLDPEEFGAAIRNFLLLTAKSRADATPYVHASFLRTARESDQSHLRIQRPEDVWKHVRFTEVVVRRRLYGDRKIYVQVSANCDWDIEHGIQLVLRDGTTLNRVSEQDSHLTHADAYDLPESEDRVSDDL